MALASRATFFPRRRALLRLAFRLPGEDWLGSLASFLDLGPIALAMAFWRLLACSTDFVSTKMVSS